jgi:glycosyltransferase involved in cell wall biosynthesis
MPHILFSDSSNAWGGLQYWMHAVARGLLSRGWDAALYGPDELSRIGRTVRDVDLEYKSLPPELEHFSSYRQVPVSQFDIIVAGTGRDIRGFGISARWHHKPVVWSVGGMPEFTWLHGLTRDRLVKYVLVPSQYARGIMMEHGWEPHQVTAISIGISLKPLPTADEISTARQTLAWHPDEFVILFVGSLRRVKRIDVLLDAFAQIAASLPATRLVIVGAGPKRPVLEEQRQRLALVDRVEFAGFQRDPSVYFTACDLFVLPSREETFGLVLLEAMMRGKPLVASGAGAIPEVVGIDEAALLVDTSTPEPLAHALQRVIGDPALRQRLAAAGPRRVKERFTEEMMLDQLDAYFRSLLR